MPIYISAIYSILSCHAFSFKGKKTPNQQIISLITVCYADLFVRFQPQNYKNMSYPQQKSAKNCVSAL
jgi:hypothetical protein